MANCPITLEPLPKGELYSGSGLKTIHPRLAGLKLLEYSAEQQIRQARLRADKMSIQGVQPKLSAVLRVSQQSFELADRGGKFILKPNPPMYEEVPAKEESALPLCGKKRNLTRKLWLGYFCQDRLGLNESQIDSIVTGLSRVLPHFKGLIDRSYLSDAAKEGYRQILEERVARLKLA